MTKFPILFAANAQVQENYKYMMFNVLSIDAGARANVLGSTASARATP